LSTKRKRVGAILIFLAAFLVMAVVCLGSGEQAAERQVIFDEVGQYADGGMAVAILVVDDLVYLCEFDRGVVILNVGEPANIVEIGRLPSTAQAPTHLGSYGDRNGDPHQFVPMGDVGYLTEWRGGLDVIDLSDPTALRRLGEYRSGGKAFSVEIVEDLAYVTMYSDGLAILDVSDPEHPVRIGGLNNGGETNALHVVGTTAYVCDKEQGLEIVDVTDPTSPALLGTFDAYEGTAGVRVVGDVAFVIHWERGLLAIDVREPTNPVEIGSFFDGGRPNGLWVEGDTIYVADGADGLEILRFRLDEGA